MSEEAYELLRKILSDRVEFWQDRDPATSNTYANALDMLTVAHSNNLNGLSQFDYL